MDISSYISIWNSLDIKHQEIIKNTALFSKYKMGTIIHDSSKNCIGLTIVVVGTLRAYITSSSGKEITLYKLLSHDVCLFSAGCLIKGFNIDINVSCESDVSLYVIPPKTYNLLMNESEVFKDYINKILMSHFEETVSIFEQVAFESMDKRLVNYLINEEVEGIINITHEKIANDLGTAREVISRILKKLENQNIVEIKRNCIIIKDLKELEKVSKN